MARYTRRRLLRRGASAAVAVGLLSQAELLAACGGSGPEGRWSELERRLHGELVRPGEPRYAAMSVPFNQRYASVRPAGIAACADVSDVQESIAWAREYEVPVAVRSGGHNYAGWSATEGLLIDVGRMRRVSVDDRSGTATAGPGARNTEVYAGLQPHEMAISAGRCPTVAIGGLVLGGGVGFSTRKLGLTCDSLLETTIVTADGHIRICSETQEPDLFWACRGGGGGNFGVNVSYKFQAQPVGNVAIYDLEWDLRDGESVLAALQEVALAAPADFSCRMGGGRAGLPGGGRGPAKVNVLGQLFGSRSELLDLLEPVLRVARPTKKVIAAKSFWAAKDYFFHNTPSDRFQVKSAFVDEQVPERGIQELLRGVASWPGSENADGGGFAMFALGGAVASRPATATAYPRRQAKFLLATDSSWSSRDPRRSEGAHLDWVEGFAASMRPYTSRYAYTNFIDRTQGDWARAYYGENLDRLRRVKRRYDSENFFSFGQSVPV